MTYRIKNGYKITMRPDTQLPILEYTGNVIVAVDPSKSNMGVVIGTDAGKLLTFIEISGTGTDTTEYCQDFKRFLKHYLQKCKIVLVGIEQAVQYKGYDYYKSQMVLTEIRAGLLAFFLEEYKIKAREINNYSWKGAILPDGYRGHKEKGSKRWLAEKGITDVSDDITDAICIFLYLRSFVENPEVLECTMGEQAVTHYELAIVPYDFEVSGVKQVFEANPDVDLRGNIGYFTNHSMGTYALIAPVTLLDLETIYWSKCYFKFVPEEDKVKILVTRC